MPSRCRPLHVLAFAIGLATLPAPLPDAQGMHAWAGHPGGGQARPLPTTNAWKTWRTIKLGTFDNEVQLRSALQEAGYSLGTLARELLNQPLRHPTQTTIDLVVVSPADLGFEGDASLREVYARAAQVGLVLCPAETGPQLRLQHKWQRVGEFLDIAMEPLAGYNGRLRPSRS